MKSFKECYLCLNSHYGDTLTLMIKERRNKMRNLILIFVLGLVATSANAQGYYNYYSEGNKKLNVKKYLEAEKIFKEGIAKTPELTELYVGLAHALVYQKKHGEADSVLDVLLLKDTGNAGGKWWKGMNFYFSKQDSLAIVWFKNYIPKIKPGDKNSRIVHWYIGQSYFHWLKTEGLNYAQTEELLYHCQKFIDMLPDDTYNYTMENVIEAVRSQRPAGRHGKWKYVPEESKGNSSE